MGFLRNIWNGIKGFFGIGSNNGQGGSFATDQLNSSLNAQRNWKYYQKQAELDHQYNLMSMDKAAEIARGQYDYEYSKESPAARVAQYEQAGLNSALMYSNGVAGMQGSVSSPSPATSRGNMHMPDSQLAQLMQAGQRARLTKSEVDVNKALEDYYRSEAQENRGETDPQRVEMKLKEALTGESNARKALDEITKKLKDIEYNVKQQPIRVEYTSSDGKMEAFETTAMFLETYYLASEVAKGMYEVDMSRTERDTYSEYLRAQIDGLIADATEAKSNANLADVRARFENFINGIQYNLEEQEGLVSKEFKDKMLVAIEKCRRYMKKEFDGSTTEWINEATKPLWGAAELATQNMPQTRTTTTTQTPTNVKRVQYRTKFRFN